MIITLSKPATLNQKQATEINLDFNKMTGNAIVEAERQFNLYNGVYNPIAGIGESIDFLAYLASGISGVIVEDIKNLPSTDFLRVIYAVKNYSGGQDSPNSGDTNETEASGNGGQ